MTVIELPYGDTHLQVEIPAAWLGEVAMPPRLVPVVDVPRGARRIIRIPWAARRWSRSPSRG